MIYECNACDVELGDNDVVECDEGYYDIIDGRKMWVPAIGLICPICGREVEEICDE